jgi:DNA-binding NtrC family response regulator
MTPTPHNLRLLLVDDEAEFLEAMKPGLARRGFEVRVADSGRAALALLETETVDAVVLDVKMPGIDGVETFGEIRRRVPGLPVILLTGHGSIPQAFETARAGVDDYVAKPCDVETLAGVVRRVVAERAPAPSTPAVSGLRLLLVDDERDFTEALVPALEHRGVHVTTAGTAAEALARTAAHRFDVAVVDVRLPDLDGLTLLTRLRDADPRLEIVLLTGHPSVDDVRRGLQEGAFDYLAKPQRVEDLLTRIHAAWQRRRAREDDARRAEADRILSRHPD